MADERITVSIEAITDSFNRGIDGVIQKLGGPGALAIAGAAAVAGAAITAFAVNAVNKFAELEQGMAEVFTLMPGMTEDAMKEMTEDVQAFSRETGALTDEVVPALYDSISAGVPKENVFDFLETANFLAVGGVTDLNTAVDGLTSVVNAYGDEVISADEASDLMFTAVKEGKTTIDELANAVGRVVPTAAGIGIKFDEVSATLATLTSQGIATNEAVTGLKAVISNVIKPAEGMENGLSNMAEQMLQNGEASDELQSAYNDLAAENSSIQEQMNLLVAAGEEESDAFKDLETQLGRNSSAQAELRGEVSDSVIETEGLNGLINRLSDSVGGNASELAEMFGSVEALNAVLALTSDGGAAKFDEAMLAMDGSAGATEEAFETMDATLSATWDKIVARGRSATQDIGQALAPIANVILKGILAAMTGLQATVETVTSAVTGFFSGMTDDMNLNAGGLLSSIAPLFEALWTLIVAAFGAIVRAWENDLKPAWEAIEPLVGFVLNTVVNVLDGAVQTITNLLNLVSALLRGDFSGAWDAITAQVETVNGFREAQVKYAMNAVLGVFENIAPELTANVRNTWDTMSRHITEAVENDRSFLSGAWDGITALAEEKWPNTVGALTGAFDTMSTMITEAVENDRTWLSGAWDGVTRLAEEKWPNTTAAVRGAFNTMSTMIEEAVENDRTWLSGAWDGVTRLAEEKWPATTAVLQGAFNTMSLAIEEAVENDRSYISGVWDGIQNVLGGIWDALPISADAAFTAIRANIEAAFDGLSDWVTGIFNDIVSSIGGLIDGVVSRIQGALERVTGIFNRADEAEAQIEDITTSINQIDSELPGSSLDPLAPSPDLNVEPFARGGIVTGPTFALIGEAGAEAVIPLGELDRLLGRASGGSQTIVIELDGETIARSTVRNAPGVLRMMGV